MSSDDASGEASTTGASSDSLGAVEDAAERTPHDENRSGPLPPCTGGRPRGPPPPRPVNEPGPGEVRASRERPPPAARSRSPSGRRPHQDVRPAASGSAGPRDRPAPSGPTGEEDVVDEEAAGNEDAASDGRWSETSHTLEGAALEDARSYFVNQYRCQLRERSEGAYRNPAGQRSKDSLRSASKEPSCKSGQPMSSRSRTRTARDVDVQSQWTNRQGLDRLARPRSLCTQQFQILAVLHPHGPLSLSATARKRAKHRRAQPCWGSELPACQAAGRTAAHPAAPYPTPRSRPPLLCPLLIGPPASRLPFYIHPSRSTRHHNQL